MFAIGEIIIEEPVTKARFACDLLQCKGACCTLPGGRGAPLDDAEVDELRNAVPFALKYLDDDHRQSIERLGMFEGVPGSYATTCIDDKDCVFVFYESGIARCSLEKAFLNGETHWKKPLSCHLFPIRVSSGKTPRIRYEKISECEPARIKGENENIPLYEYLQEPLTRKFGKEWYDEFHNACRQHEE